MSYGSDIVSNIEGFSTAMYSTWAYYRPERIMFDAGEGVSMSMRNFVFGIERIFVSHGHHDHIGGLMGIIGSRSAARGDKGKPLVIYYPKGWDTIAGLQRYVGEAYRNLSYDLSWIPVEAGSRVTLSGEGQKAKSVRVFQVTHTRNLALGFQIVENRSRLKKEFVGMPGKDIGRIRKEKGNDSVMENYEYVSLTFSGDTSPLDDGICNDSEVLMHEATFVDPEDIDRNGHSSVADAVRVAAASKVKELVLYHLSSRYTTKEAITAVRVAVQKSGFTGGVSLLDGRSMIRITNNVIQIGEGKV